MSNNDSQFLVQKILHQRKQKYAPQILSLSEKLMNQ